MMHGIAHSMEGDFIRGREDCSVAGDGHQYRYDLVVPVLVTISSILLPGILHSIPFSSLK
jgi:hypothetical protein